MSVAIVTVVLGTVLLSGGSSARDVTRDSSGGEEEVGMRPVWPIPSELTRCAKASCCYKPRVCCMGGKWCCYELVPFIKSFSC